MDDEPKGTITPNPNFSPEWAAERLKKAMRGIGSDERMIIKILVSHNNVQREEIEQKYKTLYGRDLVEDLKSELGGHFEDTVVALLTSKYDLMVTALHDSFRLIGCDAQTITEILCCRDSDCINSLCWWYEKNFEESLEESLAAIISGDFKALIQSMMSTERPPDDEEIDRQLVLDDAQRLYDAGVGFNAGKDETEFITLLSNRSFTHLQQVFEEHEKMSDEPFEKSITSEFSGDMRDGLLAIVKRVKDPHGFFSERLNMSMRGSGTDDKALIRIIVSRSEEDLESIKERYYDMYGTTLAMDVKADTGGDYAKLLLAIITNNEK